MGKKAVAVDVGSHSAKVMVAEVSKHGVRVLRFAGLPGGDGSVSLAEAGIPLAGCVCGLAGRDMNLRYSQVPPTPDWQLRNLMDLEIQDLSQQSGGSLSADYNLLPLQDEEAGVETILLALAKDEALDRLGAAVGEARGAVTGFVPNCIALYNAFLKCGPVDPDTVVCLAHIGHETIDVALVKGTDLLFARNLSTGTKALDEAIASAFNVSARKAEALKKDLLDLDPQSRGQYASGQAEKVTMAVGGAANAIGAAIQSSVSFCKAQTKIADLRLDRVLLSGGGARLRGLRSMLRENLRCPVELFDPFDNVDLSALDVDDAEQLQAMRYEAVVALGLCVGQLDDSLYALEILPEAVRRKRRFQQRTVWNLVAALIVVALLGVMVVKGQEEVANAKTQAGRLRSQVTQKTNRHNEALRLLEENEVSRAVVEHLAAQATPQNGLLLTLRSLEKHLPAPLWLRRVDSTGVGSARNKPPTITIEGAGKELNGVAVHEVYSRFLSDMKAELDPVGGKVDNLTPPSHNNTIEWKIEVRFAKAAATTTDAGGR